MSVPNALELLSVDAKVDEAAGIRIVRVLDSAECSYYVTEIGPGHSVNPHYHRQGDEIYIILEGQGTICTRTADPAGPVETQSIHRGSVFRIAPGTAHRLENTGSFPLVLLFACSPSHLADDRFIVSNESMTVGPMVSGGRICSKKRR